MKSKVEVGEEERDRQRQRQRERGRIQCFSKHLEAIMTWYSNRKEILQYWTLGGGERQNNTDTK